MDKKEARKEATLATRLRNAWYADTPSTTANSYYGEKFERCSENMVVMLGTGLAAGLVASLVLFRSPVKGAALVGLGAGCGIGSSWTTCRYKVYGERDH